MSVRKTAGRCRSRSSSIKEEGRRREGEQRRRRNPPEAKRKERVDQSRTGMGDGWHRNANQSAAALTLDQSHSEQPFTSGSRDDLRVSVKSCEGKLRSARMTAVSTTSS